MKPTKLFLILLYHSLILGSNSFSQITFDEFISKVQSTPDSINKSEIVTEFLVKNLFPITEGNKIHFVFRGQGKVVAAPGELNGWNPELSLLSRIKGTDFFYRTDTLSIRGRAEYKIWVDSVWILDPLNPRKAKGGFGDNSDVWMPNYTPSKTADYNPDIAHGSNDTVWFESKILNRKHPVYIYRPFTMRYKNLPAVYVNDGGDYLSFAKMNNVLDNLIYEGKIKPVVGVFIDPRTDPKDSQTNKRMTDYSASQDYIKFLSDELIPFIDEKYFTSQNSKDRLIMGASLGGLISTFASYQRPDVFANSAAQSPAYLQANFEVIRMLTEGEYQDINAYIDTGILYDTKTESRIVKALLLEKGIKLKYSEFPEGHNWTNWQSRLDDILIYFYGR